MNILKGLSIYTFAGFFGAGINFLVLPLLSHYLSPEEYGVLSLFNTYVTILIPLIGIVATGLVGVEYYRMADKQQFASLFSSVQLIPVVPFLLFFAVTGLFSGPVGRLTELEGMSTPWLLLMPALALLTIYVECFLNMLVMQKAAGQYAAFNIGKTLLEVGLTLLFIIYMGMGWKGRILSWLITTLIYTIIAFWYFKRQGFLSLNIRWDYMKAGVLYGAPLILHTIGKFVVSQSDRLFIAKYISLEATGIYNIGSQIGLILLIVVNAFGNFFSPFLFERLANLTHQKKLEIVRLSYMAFGILLAILIGITAATPLLFSTLIDPRYAEGTVYVFWTGLAYLLWGVYIIFCGYIYYIKKTKLLAYLAVVNVVLNIALNFLMVPSFGAIGASYATVISYLVIAIVMVYYGNKYYPMPWFAFRELLGRGRATMPAPVSEAVREEREL